MLAQVHSFVLQGIDPLLCEVEVDVAQSDETRNIIVGLPDAAVKESLERMRAAILNSGYEYPMSRMVVNLAPADIRKEGPVFDLPIAIGWLAAQRVIKGSMHKDYLMAGELALDGRVRPIQGVINLAILARRQGFKGVIVPAENASEAAAVDGIDVYPVSSLSQVVGFLNEAITLEPQSPLDVQAAIEETTAEIDFAEIRGQETVKRALTIAAAGSHNICMIGPPGTGKTMSAKALPGIMPPLTKEEALEVTRIFSTVGLIPRGTPLISLRPVRTPHHTASSSAVIGGGAIPRPGEVSLAHHGILFLDEMPEFPRMVLETLRQPLEDGRVTIARAHSSVVFPAKFMLVAALNPTQRGVHHGDEQSQQQMTKYLSRVSGPLIDRVDIHIEVPQVPHEALASKKRGTSTAEMKEKVLLARDRACQRLRQFSLPSKPNSQLSGKELNQVAALDPAAQTMISRAMNELNLSARAYDKIRRVSLTISDLDGSESIKPNHVAEAVQYRLLDRNM